MLRVFEKLDPPVCTFVHVFCLCCVIPSLTLEGVTPFPFLSVDCVCPSYGLYQKMNE